ncbi:MAG: hypothetical protein H7Z12_16710 [Rhodospirillaceae bacterium]|nr:hypothetical protein [Rhodospirillales bacterium]
MLRLAAVLVLAVATNAWAAETATKNSDTMVILSDPKQGRTMGKVNGETIMLQNTPTGTVGKMGKDKVILHKDGNGNTMGKVGDKKMFCHSDPVTGLTLCK